MRRSGPTAAAVVGLNIILAGLTAEVVGPAAFKLEHFGLIGWLARAPFYLIPVYIGPLVLWTKPAAWIGACIGSLVSLPLILWSVAAYCPPSVPTTYCLSCTAQGVLLAWAVRRFVSGQ